MKRIAAFVLAFLAVWYLQSTDADAQFRRECRAGFCVPGGSPSGTPVSNACINSSGTTITFTAQGVGGANPKRISVVSINWSDSTAAGTAQLSSVTIGGISMGRAVRTTAGAANSNSEIWSIPNPTGTTANVVATFSSAVDGVTIEVYSLIGYNNIVATTTGTTSVSQSYSNKQLAIGAASRTVNVSTSLSNMVNDFSSACGAGLWGVHASQKLSGSGTLSSSISPTSNNPKIALAVWTTGGIVASCTQSGNFLARATGLDTAHQTNYDTLICGLVTDGTFAKMEALHVYATQNSSVALLNLISGSYTAIVNGAPTFTTDRGYTGVAASTTIFINTTFNPVGGGTLFLQDGAHLSAWSVQNTAADAASIIGAISPSYQSWIAPKFTDNNFYSRVNTNGAGNPGVANATTNGHFLGNRSSSSAIQGYKNGSMVINDAATTSSGLANLNFYVLGHNTAGAAFGSAYQCAMSSIGGKLTSGEVTSFYNRLRTYMTAVGVP